MKQENKNCIDENALLDINTSNVFVAKSAKIRAFIEQFNYSSVNFTQKDLGTILGFFVVRDNTETSKNIVNFLASEIKKKYFSPIQKDVEEKFESTLHHVNRALEELANIGNVEWLGQIDGAVCVIDATTIHFSITGNAHVLLLRDNTLIDISKDLAHEEASEQPLKTFIDISSGDLCPSDKIIITSQELLDIISFDELQKNAINFGQKNFIQFIETVLTNECSLATTTIIDVYEKEKPQSQLKPLSTKEVPSNAFSANAFKEELEQISETIDDTDELDMPEEKPSEYTDPRTGHIHIQGDDEPITEQTFIKSTQEKLLELFDDIKESTITKWNTFSKKIFKKNKSEPVLAESATTFDNTEEFDDIPDTTSPDISAPESSTTEKSITKFSQITLRKIKQIGQTFYSATKDTTKKTVFYCKKTAIHFKNTFINQQNVNESPETPTKQKHSFLPSIHHITELWHKMDTRTKLTTTGILLFIIIVPLVFAKVSKKKQEDVVNIDNINIQQPHVDGTLEKEPNTLASSVQNNINDPSTLLTDSSITSTILINDKLIGVTKNNIVLLDDGEKKNFSLPTNSGDIVFSTPMDDLDLIFILTTKNKLYSFSPATKKFSEQKNTPSLDYSKIIELGTYMTYLYTLDEKTITRYARIENGFDNGKNWLRENIAISKESTMAIDDDIYITRDGQITKLYKGKKESFSQDPSIQKASIIYTTEDTKFMWILDKENDTLFKTKKSTGQKIDEYTHPEFHDATSLAVAEQNNVATISTSKHILSFKLERK